MGSPSVPTSQWLLTSRTVWRSSDHDGWPLTSIRDIALEGAGYHMAVIWRGAAVGRWPSELWRSWEEVTWLLGQQQQQQASFVMGIILIRI